jgi:hypothetical protein
MISLEYCLLLAEKSKISQPRNKNRTFYIMNFNNIREIGLVYL